MPHRSKDNFHDDCDAWASRLANIEMEFSNREYWLEKLDRNKGFYDTWALECAEHLARVMQWYMSQGCTLKEIASPVLLAAFDNAPNLLCGKTLSLLIDCWKYGKDLQRLREEERPF